MAPEKLRILLNVVAGLAGSVATGAMALGHPLIALAATNVAAFLVAWANVTKPGDIAIRKLPPEVQAAVSDPPPPTQPDPPPAGPA